MEKEAERIVAVHAPGKDQSDWDYKEMLEIMNTYHKDDAAPLNIDNFKEHALKEDLIEFMKQYMWEQYQRKEASLPDPQILRQAEKVIGLKIVDTYWMAHINKMSRLREKVAFSGYAQKNPLYEYKNEAFRMFEELLADVQKSTIAHLMHVQISVKEEAKEEHKELAVQGETHLAKPAETQITEPAAMQLKSKNEKGTKQSSKMIVPDEKYLPKKKATKKSSKKKSTRKKKK